MKFMRKIKGKINVINFKVPEINRNSYKTLRRTRKYITTGKKVPSK